MLKNSTMKNDVIIIEDSPTIGMRLSEFLKESGYQNIQTALDGKSGIKLFKEFIKNKKQPIVFLDFKLPDMNAKSIMAQILEIKPDARIIIETASDESEEDIKEVIRRGAYMYLQKPIRVEELKSIMTVLEEEEAIFCKNPSSEQKDDTKKAYQEIDLQFNTYKRASVNKLSECSLMKEEDVLSYLKKLELDGKIIPLDEIREISCNSCGSFNLTPVLYCPSCNSSKLKKGKLIKHFDCGNSFLEEEYKDDKCPKCKKELKALGLDYHKYDNYYVCINCGGKFPHIEIKFVCLKCDNTFTIENGKWKLSMEYRLAVRN